MAQNALSPKYSRYLPSRARPRDHMEVFAGFRDLLKAADLLDLDHNLMKYEKRSHPSDSPAICLRLAGFPLMD